MYNMNNLTTSLVQNLRKLSAFALISISALTFQSCSKDDTPPQETTFLSITNASPTLATYNILLNQSKINTAAVAYLGTSGYMPLVPGAYNIKFTTASSIETVIAKDENLATNNITSLFLIGTGSGLEILKVKDELSGSTSKAFVRFINLAPNSPALDLAVKDGAVIVSDKAYKSNSAFVEIDPKTYVFQIKDKATGTLAKADLESIQLQAGKSYTVLATGLLNPSDTERGFGGKVIINQ